MSDTAEQTKPSFPTWKKLSEAVKTRQTTSHPRNFEEQEDIGTMGEVELNEDKLPLTPLLQIPELVRGHKWMPTEPSPQPPTIDTDTLRKLNQAEPALVDVESATIPATVIVGAPFGQKSAVESEEKATTTSTTSTRRPSLLSRIFGSFGSNDVLEQQGVPPTIDTETLRKMTLQPSAPPEKVEAPSIPGPESYRVGFGGAEITPPSALTSEVAREAKQKVHNWEETAKEKWRHLREDRAKTQTQSKPVIETSRTEQEIRAPSVVIEREEPVKPHYKTYGETYTPTKSHRVVTEKVPAEETMMGLDPTGILDQPTATPTRNTVIPASDLHAKRLSREEKREIARHDRIWMDDPGALHDLTMTKMVETAEKIAGAQHTLTAEEKREIAKKDRVWWTSP